MNKAELLEALASLGMRPGKLLGQNFLLDANLLDFIVRSAEIRPEELVLEAGPGFGVLTRALLAAGARVKAIEFDHRECEYLRNNLAAKEPRLTLIEGDAVRVNIDELVADETDFQAVANLPYSISSLFIVRMIELNKVPRRMLFMLQKEMAQRVAAKAGSPNYGALSVRVGQLYDVRILRTVPPQVFFPPPAVDSALALFVRRENPPPPEARRLLSQVVRPAFSARRKQLGNTLCVLGRERALAALAAAGIEPTRRPESLDLEAFERLAKCYEELQP